MFLFWTKIIFTGVLIVGSVWLGTRFGVRYKKKLSQDIDHSPVGSVVGAALGLFAFMLAFTFQLTASRFDSRKELLMDEMIVIRTTWLRAGLLKDTHRIPIRKLIREYVDLHILSGTDASKLEGNLIRSKEIQDSLWKHAMALAREDRSSEIYALFTSSINDLVDLFNKRKVTILQYGMPEIVLWVLYFIAFFSMLILGFQFGLSGKSNTLVILSLAVIFSAVMWLIFALDDPKMGIIKVNQQQIYELQKEIRTSL